MGGVSYLCDVQVPEAFDGHSLSTALAFPVNHVVTETGAEVEVRGSSQTERVWA